MTLIVFENVKLKYHYEQSELLKGVSFVLDQDTNTILCDTQSGKTSICRLLCKDITASGNIFIDEKPLESITLQDLGILYLPSNPAFFEGKSVLYNASYPLKVRKYEKSKRKQIAADVLQRVGFCDVNRKIKTLTQSERKSLALARGLTAERKIVLFDDFFGEDNISDLDKILSMFPNSQKVIVTSNVNLSRGKTVVLDGGVTAYQGDADGARGQVSQLMWLSDSLRSKDNG